MNILVTGASGFLGSNLILSLSGHNVISLSRRKPVNCSFSTWYSKDIRDKDSMNELFTDNQIECVFHTAAKTDIWGRKKDYFGINFLGTKNLLELSKSYGVKKFIYTSSPSVVFAMESICGKSEDELNSPKKFFSHYAESKSKAEDLVLSANSKDFLTCALRPHLIWGAGDTHLVPTLLSRARKRRLRQVGQGKNKVSLCYIDNAVQAHTLAMGKLQSHKSSPSGKAYFIADKKPVVLWDWINELLLSQGIMYPKKISYFKAYLIGAICEFLYKFFPLGNNIPMTRFVSAQLAKSHYFNLDASKEDLGYDPKTVKQEEGLKGLLNSVKS